MPSQRSAYCPYSADVGPMGFCDEDAATRKRGNSIAQEHKSDGLTTHTKSIHFWNRLHPDEQAKIAKVTEDIPLAIRDLAGFMAPYKAMLRGSVSKKMIQTFVIMLRLLINFYTAVAPMVEILGAELSWTHSHSHADLHNGSLKICHKASQASRPSGTVDVAQIAAEVERCDEHQDVYGFLSRVITVLEGGIILAATIAVIYYSAYFVFWLSDTDESSRGQGALSSRAMWVKKMTIRLCVASQVRRRLVNHVVLDVPECLLRLQVLYPRRFRALPLADEFLSEIGWFDAGLRQASKEV